MDETTNPLDSLDRALIAGLSTDRATVTDAARTAGVARGTAYSRIERMERNGVITGWGPAIDPYAAGFVVTAFCTLEIAQRAHGDITAELAAIPEVLEVHTVTGIGDLLCRVVARSNDHLHDVLLEVTSIPGVSRSQTQLALRTAHRRRMADLLGSP